MNLVKEILEEFHSFSKGDPEMFNDTPFPIHKNASKSEKASLAKHEHSSDWGGDGLFGSRKGSYLRRITKGNTEYVWPAAAASHQFVSDHLKIDSGSKDVKHSIEKVGRDGNRLELKTKTLSGDWE